MRERLSNRRGSPRSTLMAIGSALGLLGLVVAAPLALLRWAEPSRAEVSDSDVIGINRLEAATLDIEIGEVQALVGLADRSGGGARNLAPGDVVVGAVEVANVGSLPLRYTFTVDISQGSLRDWLTPISWVPSGVCADEVTDRVPGPGPQAAPRPDAGIPIDVRLLEPGQGESLCLAAHLALSAPNALQGQELVVAMVARAEHAVDLDR